MWRPPPLDSNWVNVSAKICPPPPFAFPTALRNMCTGRMVVVHPYSKTRVGTVFYFFATIQVF